GRCSTSETSRTQNVTQRISPRPTPGSQSKSAQRMSRRVALATSAFGRALEIVLVRCAAILRLAIHPVRRLVAHAVLLEDRIGLCRLHPGQQVVLVDDDDDARDELPLDLRISRDSVIEGR